MEFKFIIESGGFDPVRASADAAGWDLCTPTAFAIAPGDRLTIPLAIRSSLPAGTYLRLAPRSGLAHKYGLNVLAGVIDRDYRGVIGVILHNTGTVPFTAAVGDRICQAILTCIDPRPYERVVALSETARGAGGFGSTGTGTVAAMPVAVPTESKTSS